MKTLTILRHAKSSWKDSSLSDHDRPLNKRGERDAPIMASRIHQAGLRPSLILSSPAARAWKTAKIVAHEISYPIEFLQRDERLYHAGVNRIIDVLLTHNIPTCGVVSLTIDTDDWNLKTKKNAELAIYDYPKKRDS
jgi:phosphohistidine phosphatase